MYKLVETENFRKKNKKFSKNNPQFKIKLSKTLKLIQENPFHPSLKSHRAEIVGLGKHWSSWVTGDIRIIWDFDEDDKIIILLLDIGKHSGKHKVYK